MDAAQLADRLADMAEAVCRHYLSNGRREGRSWRVGDVRNAPGRSVTVRLMKDQGGRPAGKWQDLATGEYGDLLDIIREAKGLRRFADVTEEARRFLANPPHPTAKPYPAEKVASGSPAAARRLFNASMAIQGTLAEQYLKGRGVAMLGDAGALRYHPCCYYGGPDASRNETWPALIAAVSDGEGNITGIHRTYLDPDGFDPVRLGKAPVECPKRSMGSIHGHGVRFGIPADVMAVGEGIETVRSLKDTLPSMPMVSALSTAHLAELVLPDALQHLYIIEDNDDAGRDAAKRLADRAGAKGIGTTRIAPLYADLNEDLRNLGHRSLSRRLAAQLRPADAVLLLARLSELAR